MPYLNIKTSQKIKKNNVISDISSFMAGLLNKPEGVMMVSLEDEVAMLFAGQNGPAAFVQLKSIGMTGQQCKDIAPEMNRFFASVLEVPDDRIYIDMHDIDRQMFAFKGNTFA